MKFLKLLMIGVLFAFLSSVSSAVVLHDSVQTTANLNTRASASSTATLIATIPLGGTGTIDDGPQTASGYTWWFVRWSSGQTGWSIQDYLSNITPNLLTYTESLGYGWTLFPWANTTVDLLSGTRQFGTYGIQTTTTAPWARLYLKTNGLNVNAYQSQTLRFSINGGTLAGQNLYVGLYNTSGAVFQYVNVATYVTGGNLSPNTWYDVAIPLSEIGASGQIVGGFVIETAQPMTFYVDQIWFATPLDSTKWTPPSSTITGVSVSCSPSSIRINQTSQCTANVSGTGSYSPAVSWSTNAGSINSSGLFTAPANATTTTITATSIQNSTKYGTFNVSVTTPPPIIQAGNILYSESVGTGWFSGGWANTNVNLASTAAYYGQNGIEISTLAQWGRFQFISLPGYEFNTANYDTLSFFINIGKRENEDIYVTLLDASAMPLQYVSLNNVLYVDHGVFNQYLWTYVRIPLSALGGSNRKVYGLEIQSSNPATFYLDEVKFESNGGCQ